MRKTRKWWHVPLTVILVGAVLYAIWTLIEGIRQTIADFDWFQPGMVVAGDGEPEPVAPHPDLTGFDPGNIISDQVFFNPQTMTLPQVQQFLETVGHGCRPGPDGTPCLMNYRENTQDIAAGANCRGYRGEANEPAATIIFKSALSCGINPQVLLVTLQKEQGLLTASGNSLNPTRYRSAMGFACPDGGSCDPEYAGFATQVFYAAAQFQAYRSNPGHYSYHGGQIANIAYSPDPACGASPVFIRNQATAGLYNYTPYQPDSLVLAGEIGDCSSHGNANFYGYFRVWFGDPRGA